MLLQEGVRAALDRALSRESCVTSETWAQRARPFHFYLCRFRVDFQIAIGCMPRREVWRPFRN